MVFQKNSKMREPTYNEFKEKILTRIEENPIVCREQFVIWHEHILYKRKGHICKDTTRVKKKSIDRQLKTLHKVMNDLVLEGILLRTQRVRPNQNTRYIYWSATNND
jgi:hypothetical protein